MYNSHNGDAGGVSEVHPVAVPDARNTGDDTICQNPSLTSIQIKSTLSAVGFDLIMILYSPAPMNSRAALAR